MNSKLPFKILKDDNGGNSATVYLYGYIGQQDWWDDGETDITDVAFLKTLKDFEKAGKKRLDVRINSYGGSMLHMDGIIALMQSSSMEVHTWNDGVAASAAADIFLAAPKERRHLAKNAKLMIHAPSAGAYGTAQKLRDAADMLDVFEAGAIAQMAADTGMTEEAVKSTYFDGSDHWLSAKQAVEVGFVSKIEDYEAQDMPKEPEKMSRVELQRFFQQPNKESEIGWFKKLFTAAFPEKVVETISPVKEEEMNLDNLKTSLGTDIAEDEVVKLLQERGYDVTKKAPVEPAPAVDIADVVTKAVAAAVKPMQDKIDSLEKLLDETPGSGPTVAKAAGDPPADEQDVVLTEAEKAAQDNFNKKLQAERRGGDW